MLSKQYIWDGIIKTAPLGIVDDAIRQRVEVFAKAKQGLWTEVIDLLPDDLSRLEKIKGHHIIEPDEPSLNTLLHYMALTNAPVDIVDRFVQAGASRTRRNAQGQRAVDIAREQGHYELVQLLEPTLIRVIPADTIQQIENHFHLLLVYPPNDPYQLPQIEVLLEGHYSNAYFPIIGAYGGFNYGFDTRTEEVILSVAFESRVVAGSERSYKVTVSGSELLD